MPTYHEARLSTDIASIRRDPSVFSDVTLVTKRDGREFPAHKAILAARSKVFRAMFCGNKAFVESNSNRVEITDIDGDVMKAMLDYIYTGDIDAVGVMPAELMEAADK